MREWCFVVEHMRLSWTRWRLIRLVTSLKTIFVRVRLLCSQIAGVCYYWRKDSKSVRDKKKEKKEKKNYFNGEVFLKKTLQTIPWNAGVPSAAQDHPVRQSETPHERKGSAAAFFLTKIRNFDTLYKGFLPNTGLPTCQSHTKPVRAKCFWHLASCPQKSCNWKLLQCTTIQSNPPLSPMTMQLSSFNTAMPTSCS